MALETTPAEIIRGLLRRPARGHRELASEGWGKDKALRLNIDNNTSYRKISIDNNT
jgi:hypothetical protein